MTTILRPDRRADIINALCVLAVLRSGATAFWPGLTEAVHWLVDDTFWDQRDPSDDIGTILVGKEEADAVAATLEPLLAILDELGPIALDEDYIAHQRWHEVAHAAADAHQLMTGERPLPKA